MTILKGKSAVRVRFPPSPTGHFHLGGARTALFNWLFARQHGGTFILRIEDTDVERSDPRYEEEIYESLRWLGFFWDEGPVPAKIQDSRFKVQGVGEYGPYRQSERTEIYKKYLQKLLNEEKAYWCYCSKEELEAQRATLAAEGLPSKYSGTCRNLTVPPPDKTRQAIRFKLPEATVEFKDLIRGNISFDASLFGDIVIARDDESPLYNFAVAVDDHEMKITHVIRGEEHISNTPKQILIQRALGFEPPLYAHPPLILAPDRSKLSKRYTETSLLEYREKGYLPEATVNFLALLGWHPKDDREILSMSELVKEFSLKRVQKAGAMFNQEKLDWINAQYLRTLPVENIVERLRPFLLTRHIASSDEFLSRVFLVERERIKTLSDFADAAQFFFSLSDYPANLLIWKGDSAEKTEGILWKILEAVKKIPAENFTSETILFAVAPLTDEEGRGTVLWPLRVALSGQAASPDPVEIAEILGKDETLERVTVAVRKLKKSKS